MIEITRHEDVLRLRMWTWRSAAAGYDVSAYIARGILIDTGFRHVCRDLERALSDNPVSGAIVTHWHEDHAGNAPRLAAMGLPLWLSEYSERKLRERPQVKLYRHVVWGRPRALVGEIARLNPPPAPLQVIATPGHAPDHHVVFDPDTETLFSADLWLGARASLFGRSENPEAILASLERVIALRPRRMFDAHRGLIEPALDALTTKRDWLQARVTEIARRLAAGDSERDITRNVLGGEDFTAYVSEGEYSRRNLVRAVARFGGR